jgi:hypothetical protein
MRFRKIMETWGLGTLIACGVAYWVLTAFHDEIRYADSCDSTEPTSAAQVAALADLKARKATECQGQRKGCQYLISEQDDGALRVKFWNNGERTGSECMSQDCCYEEYFYDAAGRPLPKRAA